MKTLLFTLIAVTAHAQCTLTGVSQTSGTSGFTLTFTGMTGPSCPASSSIAPVTIDPVTGDIHTPGTLFVGEGSGIAGAVSMVQGAAPASFPANSFSWVAPTSIPGSYRWQVPSTDGSGCLSSNGAATPGLIGISACSGGGGTSGALILLEEHTASNSSSLDFPVCITPTYDDYVIEAIGILPTVNLANVLMRLSTNGGSTYDSAANYSWAGARQSVGGSAGSQGFASTTSFGLDALGGVSSSTTAGTFGSTIHLQNPLGGTGYPRVIAQSGSWDNTANPDIWSILTGSYKSLTPVNAFRILASSGNLASGTVRCYGVAK